MQSLAGRQAAGRAAGIARPLSAALACLPPPCSSRSTGQCQTRLPGGARAVAAVCGLPPTRDAPSRRTCARPIGGHGLRPSVRSRRARHPPVGPGTAMDAGAETCRKEGQRVGRREWGSGRRQEEAAVDKPVDEQSRGSEPKCPGRRSSTGRRSTADEDELDKADGKIMSIDGGLGRKGPRAPSCSKLQQRTGADTEETRRRRSGVEEGTAKGARGTRSADREVTAYVWPSPSCRGLAPHARQPCRRDAHRWLMRLGRVARSEYGTVLYFPRPPAPWGCAHARFVRG